MLRPLVIASLALAACSTGKGGDATTPRAGTGAAGTSSGMRAEAAPGVGLPVSGELGGCNPVGRWRAHGTFPHTGDCTALPESIDVEVTVAPATAGGYRLVYGGDGELVPDNLSARGGDCAISFELHRREPSRALVLFFHLAAGGPGGVAGTGIWDEYEPGGDGGAPRIRCSDAIAVAVRAPGSAPPPSDAGDGSAAAPERRRKDDQ